MKRYRLQISGIVQGVGFRPFVYKLARGLDLGGWVLNSPAGVVVEIEGEEEACLLFCRRLRVEAPAAARIDGLTTRELAPEGEADFLIRPSTGGARETLVAPDLAVCADCRAELLDPANRRYRYPFINCTNCGPRFTIIENLPYDRPVTTMKGFPMCAACAAEYADPADRRFHAQPNACAVCGPELRLLAPDGGVPPDEPLARTLAALKAGQIAAVKGLGGYHLACDATNNNAVLRLRGRKYRWDKPFAVMLRDLATVRQYCLLNPAEEALLTSRRAPIVLLQKRRGGAAPAEAVAPGAARLGVMLPYTPLHVLLLAELPALVMTSANHSEEPIIYHEQEEARLHDLADLTLAHNRPIFRYCDDSVAFVAAGAPRLIRRSRGYAPEPLRLAGCDQNILALGGEQKNTFCLTHGEQAFLSQHIGDLDESRTYAGYLREIAYFQEMFNCRPTLVAHDLHPAYQSSQYALTLDLPRVAVQHHHAHLASVLAEYDLPEAVGLIYDGTGYGPDGTLWGGEVLVGSCARYERAAHLLPLPLAGGAQAIREPWRQALAALLLAEGEEALAVAHWQWPAGWPLLAQSIRQGVNAPLSSGMGRLFDALAALAGLGRTVNYEGQAAVLLEQAIEESARGSYQFEIATDKWPLVIDWRPVVRAAAADLRAGRGAGVIAARFHRALLALNLELARLLKQRTGLKTLALSGGCWQNIWLLENTTALLQKEGYLVYSNAEIPANDGGLAFGQAAVAFQQTKE